MNVIKNKNGIALIIALVIAFIILVLGSMALYITTQSTKMSSSFKQYRSSIDAADGAFNDATRILGSIKVNALANVTTVLTSTIKKSCLHYKLTTPTKDWTNNNLSSNLCLGTTIEKADSTNINDIISYYDLKYTLGNYDVYLKITNSAEGNTSKQPINNNLTAGGVTGAKAGTGVSHLPTIPYLYRIDIVSQSKFNANDKAVVSVLYGY